MSCSETLRNTQGGIEPATARRQLLPPEPYRPTQFYNDINQKIEVLVENIVISNHKKMNGNISFGFRIIIIITIMHMHSHYRKVDKRKLSAVKQAVYTAGQRHC